MKAGEGWEVSAGRGRQREAATEETETPQREKKRLRDLMQEEPPKRPHGTSGPLPLGTDFGLPRGREASMQASRLPLVAAPSSAPG